MTDLQKVMERAIKDPAYGPKLKSDPAGALKEAGVASTPKKVKAMKESVESLLKARQAFGEAAPD